MAENICSLRFFEHSGMLFQLLQETAAPEDMFDDVMGQTAPAPAAAAAHVAEVDTDSLLIRLCCC